ncbi:flagellar hook-associated protein 3 [Solemya pervernicosa gill symbiont]|uniref:Flagellar hook-associated protein 3 n=1 Tax=Solemya pervernicosa gill symbiont TaxID=642797 RepID=A0A1T2L995_9GAMM|nr:flagellar hook-associated protein FlgL [Solemya pervernicosa gill symbiont]OOZ41506.1 flagellar hook-associated protein 3 [Solemya pervernicosa gill symbiont]
MRISTSLISQLGVNSILDQQAKLSETQIQLATGKRLLNPSDDPSASAKVLDLNEVVAQTQQYIENTTVARSRLELEEGSLADVNTALYRIRELAVQGANASQTSQTRAGIAAEVKLILDGLISTGNARDANGEFIFSGYQTKTTAFERDGAGGFTYNGDQGQRHLQISPTRQVAVGDSGDEVFMSIKNGNGIFSVADNLQNRGTGIIDPGAITDPTQYVADTYGINFPSLTTAAVDGVTQGSFTDSVDGSGGAVNVPLSGSLSVADSPIAASSFTMVDSLGVEHQVDVTLTSTGSPNWNVELNIPGDTTGFSPAVQPLDTTAEPLALNFGIYTPPGGGAPITVDMTVPAIAEATATSVVTADDLGYELLINGTSIYLQDEEDQPLSDLDALVTAINNAPNNTAPNTPFVEAAVVDGALYLRNVPASSTPITVTERITGGADAADEITGYFGSDLTGIYPADSTAENNMTVDFTEAGSVYTVNDSLGNVVTSGQYEEGGQIAFNGMRTYIEGGPLTGDSFTVEPSENQDLFATIQTFIDALEGAYSGSGNGAAFSNAMNRVLMDLGQAEVNIDNVRAQIGGRLNALDNQDNTNADYIVQMQTTLSELQDLDYVEATARLNIQMVGMQAAQQAYVRVQGLSLFNYIG